MEQANETRDALAELTRAVELLLIEVKIPTFAETAHQRVQSALNKAGEVLRATAPYPAARPRRTLR